MPSVSVTPEPFNVPSSTSLVLHPPRLEAPCGRRIPKIRLSFHKRRRALQTFFIYIGECALLAVQQQNTEIFKKGEIAMKSKSRNKSYRIFATWLVVLVSGLTLCLAQSQSMQVAGDLITDYCSNSTCTGDSVPTAALDKAQQMGAQRFNHWFWLQRLFWTSTSPDALDPNTKAYYKNLVQATSDRNMI